MSLQWLEWAKRIQALSQSGLTYSRSVHDVERYEELRSISVEILAEHTGMDMQQVKELFAVEQGYQTPKMDVRGAVFQKGKILMVKENSDSKWSLPGGFCDVGLSPAENITKEIEEESGYIVVPTKLLALLDMNKHPHPPQPFHYYKIFIQCEIVGGEAKNGVETQGVAFFPEDGLPELSLNRNIESQLQMLFEFERNPTKATLFE
ncbi:NUDIX hydrolase [Planococcus sp. CPCC 101016]|uniref:NUDIX hydrolase n=1 Tax=Planococcus sp. CPCC 101016 TaxID=2599617 RepID=UPI0011B36EFC|nr:NUDIX hydrolase [Planococcus sp. CPCC 101016]TWT08008.1 NUDIX hydrolase [Planococcus sp. CPCC 101016]